MSSLPRVASLFAVLACVLAFPPSAAALPEALIKTEIGCQSALAKALGKYGKARTACEAGCQKKTPLSAECTPPFGGKTLTCVQKANDKLAALIAKKCLSGGNDEDSCPECYEELNGTCAGFGTATTAQAVALTDDITGTIFCDDTGSPDGLSKAEVKCQKALVAGFTGFVLSANGCAISCLKNERKGKTDATCNPEAFLLLSGDTKTVTCIFKAFTKLSKAFGKCEAPAGDSPECATSVQTSALFERVKDKLVGIGGVVDVCPAQCGDGYTQGLEDCDPPGGNSCPGPSACSAQCTCTS